MSGIMFRWERKLEFCRFFFFYRQLLDRRVQTRVIDKFIKAHIEHEVSVELIQFYFSVKFNQKKVYKFVLTSKDWVFIWLEYAGNGQKYFQDFQINTPLRKLLLQSTQSTINFWNSYFIKINVKIFLLFI